MRTTISLALALLMMLHLVPAASGADSVVEHRAQYTDRGGDRLL
jgi:hypothetical protein